MAKTIKQNTKPKPEGAFCVWLYLAVIVVTISGAAFCVGPSHDLMIVVRAVPVVLLCVALYYLSWIACYLQDRDSGQ